MEFKPSSSTEAFLEAAPLMLFIDGKWVPSASQQTFETSDPGTARVLARVFQADAGDVSAAVTAAKRAFHRGNWSTISADERACYLHRLADLVESHLAILAEIESLDVGKPVGQARGDVQNFVQTMRYYADLSVQTQCHEPIAVAKHEARTVQQPRGPCGFIFPWNFPFLLVGWGIAPALAAGNTVVIKPAEETPLSAIYLMHLVEKAGIPAGVVNLVTGSGELTGASLARNPDLAMMSFTGSPEVGRLVARECGQNLIPVKLELGGKGAAVIFDDVDVDTTAAALVHAITLNCGQVCCTASRWIIQDSIYSRFLECAASRFKTIRIGYGQDAGTEMGPVVSEKQRNRILGYLDKARAEGATLLLEGGSENVPGKERGHYIKPAIIAGAPDNVACREEIFGPVPFAMRFRTDEEAIDLVNRSNYGLANSVWSRDLERADRVAERLVAGNSWINAHNVFVHGVPYGGVNLSGMGGGVLGRNTFFDYMRSLSVVRPL